MAQNPSYCSYFWNHICVRPDFKLQPCCRFDMGGYPQLPVSDQLEGSFNLPMYKELRRQSLAGEKIRGCQKCYDQESNGIPSLRQQANLIAPLDLCEDSSLNNVSSLEFFIGDVCNMKCMTCGPQLSTAWRSDYRDLAWPLPERSQPIDICAALNNFSNLREVKFVGGEPLLSKLHGEVLEKLAQSKPSEISLIYFTNVTVWPTERILELWKKFKRVTVWLSVDGFGPVNEYIRFPSKWDQVEKITKRFLEFASENQNIRLGMMTTLSLYNIWNIREMEQWYDKLKTEPGGNSLDYLHINPLTSPAFLSIQNLPEDLKQTVLSMSDSGSSKLAAIKNYLGSNQLSLQAELVDYTRNLDRVRGIRVGDFVPELKDLIYGR